MKLNKQKFLKFLTSSKMQKKDFAKKSNIHPSQISQMLGGHNTGSHLGTKVILGIKKITQKQIVIENFFDL